MNRLYVPRSELGGEGADERVIVRGPSLDHLRDVLRLRPGAPLEVFDGEGGIYASQLERYVEGGAELVLGPREERPFGGVRITLMQGLAKGEKFELILQKAVELGVTSLVPVATERSIVRLDAKKAADRVTRWQRIADEASRQSRRADVVRVEPVIPLEQAVARPVEGNERRLILDEEERQVRLRDHLSDSQATYSLLVGPEGGFTREEVAAAQRGGFVPVSLGPRILRTETAGLAVIAVLQHVLGDFG